MHTGISPAAAVTWSEDSEGLQLFLEAVLRRKTGGRMPESAELDAAGWTSLDRWARQREDLLASRRIDAEA